MKVRFVTILKKFPEFPSKQFIIWTFSEDTIKLRSDLFTKFLQFLFKERELLKDEYVQKFLDVNEEKKEIIFSFISMDQNCYPDSNLDLQGKLKLKYEGQNIVEQFLNDINSNQDNISKYTKKIEENLIILKTPISKVECRELLLGKDNLKGLLYFCGTGEHFIGRQACLNLLGKLTDFENHHQAEVYLEIFASTDSHTIKEMDLGTFILRSNTKHLIPGILIYEYLVRNNLNSNSISKFIKQEEAVIECISYIKNKQITHNLSHDVIKESKTAEDLKEIPIRKMTSPNKTFSEHAIDVYGSIGELNLFQNELKEIANQKWEQFCSNRLMPFYKYANFGKVEVIFPSENMAEIYQYFTNSLEQLKNIIKLIEDIYTLKCLNENIHSIKLMLRKYYPDGIHIFETVIIRKIEFLLKNNSVNITFLTAKLRKQAFKIHGYSDHIIIPGVNIELNLNPVSHEINCTIVWKLNTDSLNSHFAYVEIIYLAFLELRKIMKR